MAIAGDLSGALKTLDAKGAVMHQAKLTQALTLVPDRQIAPLVVWAYGATGTGKSRFAQWMEKKFQLTALYHLMNEENKRFINGYTGQELLVLG